MRSIPALLLCLTLAATLAGAEAEEAEVVVTIDQVPAAVKQTILKESGGAKLDKIEKETENGKVVYSAEWTAADGKTEVEIEISEDGTVLKQEDEAEAGM